MKKLFVLISFLCSFLFSLPAFAGVGETFDPTPAGKIACEAKASEYKPTTVEKPAWVATAPKATLGKAQCVLMNTARSLVNTSGSGLSDYRWVYLTGVAPMVQYKGRWLHADCLNDTNWQVPPAPVAVASPPPAPAPNSSPATPSGCSGEGCRVDTTQTVTHTVVQKTVVVDAGVFCRSKDGRVTPQPPEGCPFESVKIVRPTEVSHPTSQSCSVAASGGTCQQRPTAPRFVQEVASPFCGIRTNHGDVLAILDNNGNLEVAKNPKFSGDKGNLKISDPGLSYVFTDIKMSQFGGNCDAAQRAIETAGWAKVVEKLQMPSGCQAGSRISGPITQK